MHATDKTYKNIKYVGNRIKNDQENQCREKLCELVRDVGCFHEICGEKLYLVNLAQNESPKLFCDLHAEDPMCPFIFWNLSESSGITYEAFNMDFGPYNLATTHYFCSKMKVWLDTQTLRHPDKYVVIVLGDSDTKRKLNATLLVAIAAIVLLNLSDQEVIQRLDFFMMHKPKPGEPKKELIFREKKKFSDVSGNQSIMSLTLEDCIKAFYAAKQFKFYDYYDFDHAEYLFYETVMSGDLNWIVPGKLLAFAGPSDKPVNSKIYYKHPPQFYYHYFKDHGVSTIVRLNEPEYESSKFVELGFDHHDLIFPDGYPPTSTIAARFIKIVDEAKGAVAVHCYAGIGRTGTLIAAYLMAKYDFTPQAAVAWTRICRPGSVIGEQQDWLTRFNRCSVHKNQIKNRKSRSNSAQEKTEESLESNSNLKTSYAVAEKTYGQAKALLLSKKQRDNSGRPCTRNSNVCKSIDDGDSSTGSPTRKADLILDLGKTVPLMLSCADLRSLRSGENPKFYWLKDGKYEWKVKFPECGYVALKHDFKKDLDMFADHDNQIERTYREPTLDFRYEAEETQEASDKQHSETKVLPKLKPVVYFSLSAWCDAKRE